jgi:hypothetical protein
VADPGTSHVSATLARLDEKLRAIDDDEILEAAAARTGARTSPPLRRDAESYTQLRESA